jgi:hypothetical protein
MRNTTIAIYLGGDFLKTANTISTIIFHMEKMVESTLDHE